MVKLLRSGQRKEATVVRILEAIQIVHFATRSISMVLGATFMEPKQQEFLSFYFYFLK